MGRSHKRGFQREKSRFLTEPVNIDLPEGHDFEGYEGRMSLAVQFDGRGIPYVAGDRVRGKAESYLRRFYRT